MRKLPSDFRLLLIACAGVATFYVTSQWAMGNRDLRGGLDGIVVQAAPRVMLAAVPADEGAARTPPAGDSLPSVAERAKSIPDSNGNAFANLSWLPPAPRPPPAPLPPPPALPPKPAAPVTPPLPFTFVGMLERGTAKPEAFLAKGDALLVVSAGDLLDNNTYRVDSLNTNEIVMTYLPMNVQQTLSVSGRTQ